ncbi:hypothetical protein NVSP9465_01486 [Novosphingobium sp. CECT 9465]|nr:hypothetical protein NVSP9465_01486 [Novosphingobium sp. CECT 9465]
MRKQGAWRRRALVTLPLVVAGFLCGHLSAAGQGVRPAKPEPLVVSAARTLGVKRCLPMISGIAQRATSGATMQDIIVDWDRAAPDAAPFFSLTGLGNGSQRAALTIAAIPTQAGCAVLVERASFSQQTCTAVAASELQGFPSARLIDGIMVYQNPAQPGETYTLITNTGGCLILRRQASLKWQGK